MTTGEACRSITAAVTRSRHPQHGATCAWEDPSGRYRYRLAWCWDGSLPRILWVLLNPSTASVTVTDPTTRRTLGFARRWGFGSCEVVNLYALRATKPATLRRHPDPVGNGNDDAIEAAADGAALIVVGWGDPGTWADDRATQVGSLLRRTGREIASLGVTKRGSPRHPLYVAYRTQRRLACT